MLLRQYVSSTSDTSEVDNMALIKAMGYGLRGLKHENSQITDPRINVSSLLLDYEREEEATVRNFVRSTLKEGQTEANLDAALGGWHWEHMDPESTDPMSAVQHFSETSLEDTLLLRPVGSKDWTRRNALMDVYIEQANGHEGKDHVDILRGGIYPYENRFMDTETFTQVKWDIIGEWIRAVNDNQESFITELFAEEASKELGWGSLTSEALKKRIAPMPPKEIIQLAEFGKLFTNPETVYELRPMLVTVRR